MVVLGAKIFFGRLIPHWFLLSENGRKLVREQFNPKEIIAVHISPDEAPEVSEQLKKTDANIIAFTKILEERGFLKNLFLPKFYGTKALGMGRSPVVPNVV